MRTVLPKTTWKDLFQFSMCGSQQFVDNSIHGASVGSLSYKSQQCDNTLKKRLLNVPAVLLRPTSSASCGEAHATTPMDE